MNDTLKTIYSRNSVRAYKDEKVPEDIIKEVIKAGFHAACGLNAQATRFAVVSDKKKIKEYSDKGKKLFIEMMEASGNDISGLKTILDNNDNIFYGAPSVIFVFTAPNALTPLEDSSLAIGNMMIAAKSLGLGTCWIGFAAALGLDPDFVKETGSEGLKHQGTLIIGYPAKEQKPTPRNEVEILNWIK